MVVYVRSGGSAGGVSVQSDTTAGWVFFFASTTDPLRSGAIRPDPIRSYSCRYWIRSSIMVLGRLRDLISGGSSRPQQDSPSNGASSDSSKKKSYLRLSSSLQDLSTYDRHDSALHLPLPPLADPHERKKNKKKKKKWLCLVAALSLCLLLAVWLLLSARGRGRSRFYVVLDSGSTGTRVYVYEASPAPRSSALPFVISEPTPPPKPSSLSGRAYRRVETEPGFHKLVHNSSGLRAAIRPLLQWAQQQIPRHAHKTTALFLYATAGVRRLPPAHSKWVLDSAWSVLRTSPFECRREWVRAVSGTEEAYLGWVALNHATGVLGALPRKPTFGALDLGGSSLQVTFESDVPSAEGLDLRIGSANHHLTAYSLPGYGLNDAFDKSVASSPGDGGSVKHPCLHSGYHAEAYACSHCNGNGNAVVALAGAPQWDQCAALAEAAVNASDWPHRPYGQLYAMSGFYVVFRFFNLSAEGATLDRLLEEGRRFCAMPWEEARSSVAPQPFIEQYCFRAPYIVALLRRGLGVKETQIMVGSGSITWTLGVAVLEAGSAFSAAYPQLPGAKPLLLLLLLSASALLLACALWRRLNLNRYHLPLFRHNSAGAVPSVLRLQRWSPISTTSGDGRAKMPLSPTTTGSGEIQLMDSSSTAPLSSTTVAHSYSSNNLLGPMQFDGLSPFWAPHNRSQMGLQSRRSQSREDLHSQLADPHLLKA